SSRSSSPSCFSPRPPSSYISPLSLHDALPIFLACRCATSSGELDSAERPLRRRLPIPRPSMRTPPTDRSSRMSGASREPSQLPRAWELANTRQPLYPPFIGSRSLLRYSDEHLDRMGRP